MSSVAKFTPDLVGVYGSVIHQQLSEQQQSGFLTDFILSCQGQELRCHRAVLAAVSPYFTAMFRSGMKEAEQRSVVLDTLDADILKWIVEVIYGRCVPLVWEKAHHLMEACELLQLLPLKEKLDEYVTSNIDSENCIRWWKMADNYNMKSTSKRSKDVMFCEFEKVSKSDAFVDLSFAELVDYIQSDELKVPCQDTILSACIGWVLADVEERKPLMLDVLKAVKLDQCSNKIISKLTKTQKELFTEPDVKSFVYDIFLPRLQRSEHLQHVFVAGGMSRIEGKRFPEIWKWNSEYFSKSWEQVASIPLKLLVYEDSLPACVLIPNGVVVISGGSSGTQNSRFDFRSKQWYNDIPETPARLNNSVALYTNENISVIDGGMYDSIKTDTMYVLTLQSWKWSKGPSLLEKQYRPRVTAHNESLYVVYNDSDNRGSSITLQMLSSGAKNWVYKSSVPNSIATYGACFIGIDDKLYLIGGKNKICIQYLIATDQWTAMTSKPSANHWYGSVFAFGKKIFLCGGGTNANVTDMVEEYDIENDKWSESDVKLPQPMVLFNAACVSV